MPEFKPLECRCCREMGRKLTDLQLGSRIETWHHGGELGKHVYRGADHDRGSLRRRERHGAAGLAAARPGARPGTRLHSALYIPQLPAYIAARRPISGSLRGSTPL
ncbi:hypothetical protein HPB47_017098 [Ixodes persulcatus]|uniref:Uncharacterized protein n=1 Tax=Ixodes persulcatus TaxID=34615 RepID=A0AC60QPF3_IXOPE|nr:hypothetical protein HPB47_017098 [Ixodes persulcatus]